MMYEFFTSPWFIVGIIVAFLISNIATVRFLSNKNFKSYHKDNKQLDKLIALDKKKNAASHRQNDNEKGGSSPPAP